MNGKVQEIQKKYANNKEKQQQEIAELYAREGVNPMSGCLWSFLPFPILIALYYIIRTPLRYFMSLSNEVIAKITELAVSLGYVSGAEGQAAAYDQIYLAKFIHDNWSSFDGKFDGLIDLNYTFLNMDLSAVPQDLFSQFPCGGWPVIGLMLMPIISAALQFLMTQISHDVQRQQQRQRLFQGHAVHDAADDRVDGLHPARRSVRVLDRQRRLLLPAGAAAEQEVQRHPRPRGDGQGAPEARGALQQDAGRPRELQPPAGRRPRAPRSPSPSRPRRKSPARVPPMPARWAAAPTPAAAPTARITTTNKEFCL